LHRQVRCDLPKAMTHPEAGELSDDDLPDLVGEDGESFHDQDVSSPAEPPAKEVKNEAKEVLPPAAVESGSSGPSEEETLRAAAALQAHAALNAAQDRAKAEAEDAQPITAADAMRELLEETTEKKPQAEAPDEKTLRMVKAISKDDFEECEDAIMQGADVNADCGAGMRALHITALRGEMFLTELLLAHGANVNERDLSGNTPLLYACHFYRQHGKGVQMVSQLLHHRADPFYRIRDGKLAGKSAYDLMEKACHEPNTDENVPRQMRAMLQLAMEGTDACRESITKVWMSFKSQNKKLYQVSSKSDDYGYAMKSIEWALPDDVKKADAYAPVKLEDVASSILEEKFTYLKDYSFNDEGDKVKIYVQFPESAASALSDKGALSVDFDIQSLDVKLKALDESFRLRIEPLFGTVEVSECKHRVSAASRRVTLTLVKRHKSRRWPGIQKPR